MDEEDMRFSQEAEIENSSPETPTSRVNSSIESQELEKELSRWNWGAFLLTWIWGLFHKVWWSLLVLIPIWPVSLFIAVLLGARGNRLAWRNKKYLSLDEFRKSQKRWAYSGLLVFIIIITLVIVLYNFYFAPWYKKKAGISLSQTFQVTAMQRDIEKLSSGALIIKRDTGSFPKSMSEIINSKNFKVILSLEGLSKIPEDASGQRIRYCLYKDHVYFVYRLSEGSKELAFYRDDRLTGSITEEELKNYYCRQD